MKHTSTHDKVVNDQGFTPAEIIIGVILVAILATGVTVQAVKLMGRARDSAAQTTLRTAVAAAKAVYANMLPGGYNNYSGKAPVSGVIAGAAAAAVSSLNLEEPSANFEDYDTYVGTDLGDTPPRPQAIWVHVIADAAKELKRTGSDLDFSGKTNANGNINSIADVPEDTTITAGDLVRMGVISATGNSYCVILVGNDSHGRVTGEGWQAASEALTQDDKGADCGVEAVDTASYTANDGPAMFAEMPDTIGTDPKPSSVVDDSGIDKTYTK
ncbi:MAG: hypothetical protein OXI96_08195 [Acidimicrobiaceae bacterium]|nr:hypothetical protein [Acidimicrobiaceae bacterium]